MKEIVIVGAGAIGSKTVKLFSKENLKITVIDRDVVMPENTKNQLYKKSDIHTPKAYALKNYFEKINPLAIELNARNCRVLKSDLVLDCVDNLDTRRIINNYCMKNKIPWIHSSAIKDTYEVMPVFRPGFAAVFHGKKDGLTCEQAGLMNKTAQKASNLQYELGMKILRGEQVKQELIRGKIGGQELRINVTKKTLIEELPNDPPTKLCGRALWQFKREFKLKKEFVKEGNCFLFKDGRVLVNAKTQNLAKQELDRVLDNYQ